MLMCVPKTSQETHQSSRSTLWYLKMADYLLVTASNRRHLQELESNCHIIASTCISPTKSIEHAVSIGIKRGTAKRQVSIPQKPGCEGKSVMADEERMASGQLTADVADCAAIQEPEIQDIASVPIASSMTCGGGTSGSTTHAMCNAEHCGLHTP